MSMKPTKKRAASAHAEPLPRDPTRLPPYPSLRIEHKTHGPCTEDAIGLRLATNTEPRAFELAAMTLFERFQDLLPSGTLTSAQVDSRPYRKMTPNAREKIKAALTEGRWRRDEAFVSVASDRTFEEEAFSDHAFALKLWRFSGPTEVELLVPARYVWSVGVEAFQEVLVEAARNTPFDWGMAGILPRSSASTLLEAWPHAHTGQRAEGVTPGVAWLTFLGPDALAKLGGLEALRAAVPEGVTVLSLGSDRAAIRALEAPTPELGERELMRMQALAKVLWPVTEAGSTIKAFGWDARRCAHHELGLFGIEEGARLLEERATERNTMRDRTWLIEVLIALERYEAADAALSALRRDEPEVSPLGRGDGSLVDKLAVGATRSGKHPDIANRWLDHMLEHRYTLNFQLALGGAMRFADLLTTLGRYDEACAEAAVVLARYEDYDQLPDRLARLAHTLGKTDEAAGWAHRKLAVCKPDEYDALLERYRALSIL